MKHPPSTQNTARTAAYNAGPEASPDRNGVAIAPPAYGIDVIDSIASEAMPAQGQEHQARQPASRLAPSGLHSNILTVQRSAGSRAVNRLLDGAFGQPLEPATRHFSVLQRACACGGSPGPNGECAECRKKRLDRQRAAEEGAVAQEIPPIVHEVLRSPGQPLDAPTRTFMEQRFGQDFGGVRVHTDAQAADSARAVNALAYTVGREVVFGAGQYAPESREGRRLLAHELTHVMQQGSSQSEHQARGVSVEAPGTAFEREATDAADAITRGDFYSTTSNSSVRLARQGIDAGISGPTDASLLGKIKPTAPAIYEHNTELGGLSVGNFDFHFNNCRILIWVWVKFQFESGITAVEQAAFKQRFFQAVHGTWAHSGYSLTGSAGCPCPSVPIEIHAEESKSGYYQKLVDVERAARRENVISDMNLSLSTDDTTIAHEFGHVLGLYDEYDGGWLENIMFWHQNQPNDPNALMNIGTELRPRYFEPYRRRAQQTAGSGCDYTISSPVPPVL